MEYILLLNVVLQENQQKAKPHQAGNKNKFHYFFNYSNDQNASTLFKFSL